MKPRTIVFVTREPHAQTTPRIRGVFRSISKPLTGLWISYPWMILTLAVAFGFLGIALAVSSAIGVPVRDPEGTLLGKRVVLPFIFMAIFFGMDVYIRARSERGAYGNSIPRALKSVFIERWWWKRAVIALIGFMAFNVCYLSYRNLKSFLPLTNYRTYDQELAKFDEWMTFGRVPGPYLHDLLGTTFTAHILSVIYLAFIPAVAISVAAALTFSTKLRDGYVFVAAMNWCWILGTASYYMIPTLGPFGGAPWDYDGLPRTGVTQVQESLVTQRHALYADPIGTPVVQSIAGFASLHVGIVAMGLFFAIHFRHRILSIALFAALVPTVIATIYFGWHYWLDDIAGLLIAYLSLRWALWMVYPTEQKARLLSRFHKLRARLVRADSPQPTAPPTK